MNAYIFCGPTLPVEEARHVLDAVYMPPAARGDVYRISMLRPSVIGIIDGYFDRVPSVCHKEILWAMAHGAHVFGSASMGALRAVELEPFGMIGIGKVFTVFLKGELEDDDEVAIVHGASESGYRAASEAMVNIRWTLRKAESEGLLCSATCASLELLAKSIHYRDRCYQLLFQRARQSALPEKEIVELENWLPDGRFDQKRLDALEMLAMMKDFLAEKPGPKRVDFHFENTTFWNKIASQVFRNNAGLNTADLLLDELRLRGASFLQGQQQAKLRILALREAQRQSLSPKHVADEVTSRFRTVHDLQEDSQMEHWSAENDLSLEEFDDLMQEEALLQLTYCGMAPFLQNALLNHLRLTGQYADLKQRALDKQNKLSAAALSDVRLSDLDVSEEQLIRWHLNKQPNLPASHLSQYINAIGFKDRESFLCALGREYCYCTLKDKPPEVR